MPAILTSNGEREVWMRPLPDDALKIVARGPDKEDMAREKAAI
jgi:hypothetical protein